MSRLLRWVAQPSRRRGERAPVSVCITDTAGCVIAVGRMDGAHAGTAEYARKKACFSGRTGRDTEDYVHIRLVNDEILWRALRSDPGMFLTPGGVPITIDGETDAALARAAIARRKGVR